MLSKCSSVECYTFGFQPSYQVAVVLLLAGCFPSENSRKTATKQQPNKNLVRILYYVNRVTGIGDDWLRRIYILNRPMEDGR